MGHVVDRYRREGRYYKALTIDDLSLEWRSAVSSVADGHLDDSIQRQLIGVFGEFAIRNMSMPIRWSAELWEAIEMAGDLLSLRAKRWLVEHPLVVRDDDESETRH